MAAKKPDKENAADIKADKVLNDDAPKKGLPGLSSRAMPKPKLPGLGK